jgi:hypothetical protein
MSWRQGCSNILFPLRFAASNSDRTAEWATVSQMKESASWRESVLELEMALEECIGDSNQDHT